MNYTENEFVKINRKILAWRWFTDTCTRDVFIYCILKANWKPGSWQNIEYSRGEFITSISTIMKELNLSFQCVRTAIKHLKSTGEITDRIIHKYRIITVCNYDKYQSNELTSSLTMKQKPETVEIAAFSKGEEQTANKVVNNELTRSSDTCDSFIFKKNENSTRQPTRKEEPENVDIPTLFDVREQSADKEVNNELTRCQQTTDRQLTTDKEDKNIRTKEDKNKCIAEIIDYLNRKTGSKFRAESEINARHIRARLSEGYTPADFKKVTDKKCADWLTDKKMREYLRPSTLFGSKFESYLNSAVIYTDRSSPQSYTQNDDTDIFCERYGEPD